MSAIRELQKQLLTLRSQLAAKERECEELRTSLQEMLDRHCSGRCEGYEHYKAAIALLGGEKGEGNE